MIPWILTAVVSCLINGVNVERVQELVFKTQEKCQEIMNELESGECELIHVECAEDSK